MRNEELMGDQRIVQSGRLQVIVVRRVFGLNLSIKCSAAGKNKTAGVAERTSDAGGCQRFSRRQMRRATPLTFDPASLTVTIAPKTPATIA